MKNKKLVIILLVITILALLASCSGNANDSVDEKKVNNSNWSDEIPKEIPVYENATSIEVSKIVDSIIVAIGCNDGNSYNGYIDTFKRENWIEQVKQSEYQYLMSKGEYFINIRYSESDEVIYIEISSGDTAQFLLSNVDSFKKDVEKNDNKKDENENKESVAGHKISHDIVVEISNDKYLEDTTSILNEVQAILDEMMENVDKATSSKAKKEDLITKIQYYMDSVSEHNEIIASGGYRNLLTDELFKEEDQPSRCTKKMNGLKESIDGLVGDFNTASKYN